MFHDSNMVSYVFNESYFFYSYDVSWFFELIFYVKLQVSYITLYSSW
jgi:hypothetical protein